MIRLLPFEKKPFQFWQEIGIQVVVILLHLYSVQVFVSWNHCGTARTKQNGGTDGDSVVDGESVVQCPFVCLSPTTVVPQRSKPGCKAEFCSNVFEGKNVYKEQRNVSTIS